MVMIAAVKEELSRLSGTAVRCRRAEASTLLRFADALHITGGRVVVTAEVDAGPTARRLRQMISALYGYASEVHVVPSVGLRNGARYVVQVLTEGEALARRTGLLDPRGRPVRGVRTGGGR